MINACGEYSHKLIQSRKQQENESLKSGTHSVEYSERELVATIRNRTANRIDCRYNRMETVAQRKVHARSDQNLSARKRSHLAGVAAARCTTDPTIAEILRQLTKVVEGL